MHSASVNRIVCLGSLFRLVDTSALTCCFDMAKFLALRQIMFTSTSGSEAMSSESLLTTININFTRAIHINISRNITITTTIIAVQGDTGIRRNLLRHLGIFGFNPMLFRAMRTVTMLRVMSLSHTRPTLPQKMNGSF